MDVDMMDQAPNMPPADLTADGMGTVSMMDPMDDLFGEAADGLGVPVPMAMPSAPLPASLVFRINDMQRTGCCSKLAWSNAGYAARISSDGGKITFCTIMRDQKSGRSALSEESKDQVLAPKGVRFVHIQFNGLGIDLTVADNFGGVHMYTSAGTSVLGRAQAAPADSSVDDGIRTELDAVVGLHWLPTWSVEFRSPYVAPATKVGEKWSTQMKVPGQNAPRVHHALESRNAVLYVTSSSKLVMLFQNERGIWHSISVQLEDWQSSNQLLSHAAMGEEGDDLVLVTHDRERRFRLYKITIHWNNAQQSRSNGTFPTVSPVLEVGRLTTLDYVCPQQAQNAKLSLLRVIPALQSFADQGTSTVTTILGVFTHAPAPLNAVRQQPDAFSVLVYWTIDSITPTLHECFAKLKPNIQVPVQATVTVLRRQPDIVTSKTVLDAKAMYHNTLVALVNSNGSTDVYDRSTWTLIESFGDTLIASSLSQSGLEYVHGDHTPHVAPTIDGSAMILTKADETLDIKYVAPRYSWQPLEDGISDTKGMIETAIICLARQYAILSTSSAATDETLAILPPDLSHELRALFVKQVFRILCRNLDISMFEHLRQQHTLIREQIHLRPLSAQLALGVKRGSAERDFAGQFAYIYLNLRQISITFAQTFSTKDSNLLSRSPDFVPSLTELFRWVSDLTVFIVDTLSQIKRGTPPGASPKQAFERLAAETGNPALHILLCSFPRVLLRMQTSVIPTYLKCIEVVKTRTRTLEHRQQIEEFHEKAKEMPFLSSHFLELITGVDTAVRSAYTGSGANAARRVDIELAMMTEGCIPKELEPVVRELVETILPRFEEKADMGKVYFWDTEWLGITNGVRPSGAARYDAIRKVRLTREMKLRVCRRCGAEMEDLTPEQIKLAPDWLRHAQRHCFCQGYWWPVAL